MFTKAANLMTKAISYPSDLLAAVAMLAMVFVMLSVTLDVLIRWLARIIGFTPPILGVWDLNTMAFGLIVWGAMGMAALRGSHIALSFMLDRFPRLPRLGLELIISLATATMLAMVSWRLFAHAMLLGDQQIHTALLKLPHAPLGYFTAVACAVMALVFLARFPETVGRIRKEQ